MKLNLSKFLLAAVFLLTLCATKKAAAANVVITALPGNVASPYFLAKGASNQVVFGFSVTVPTAASYTPGPIKIAYTNSLNGLITSATLARVTTNNPALAIASAITYAGAANSSTIDFPGFNATIPANTTYYYYLIITLNTSTNPWPATEVFSVPTTGGAFGQNNYNGNASFSNFTISNPAAAEPTYYFVPVVTYATPQVYTQGTAISNLTPTSTAGTTSYSGTLPAGLLLNTTTGVISGTPTAVSTAANYTITATNNAGSSTSVINITVNPPVPAFTYPTPKTYTQGVAIAPLSSTSTGGAITTYSAASLPAGLSINASTGDITGTPTTINTATNYIITGTNAGGSSTFTINITINPALPAFSYASPQVYAQFTAITPLLPTSTGGTVTTYSASSGPAGLSLNASTGAITGTPTTVSASTGYVITATNAAGSSTFTIYIAVNLAPPTFSYATPQTYTQGTAISTLSPTSTGSAVASYSAASLPAGLSINTTTGAITGTPTVISTATDYTITATNSAGSSTATVNITVNPTLPAISYPSPQTFKQGISITPIPPTSTGGPVATYSAASLPAGLVINASTGAISGTPTTISFATNYTITATNATGSTTATINITVTLGPPNISYPTPQTLVVGTAVTLTPTNTGGTALTYTASGLPAGLTINATSGVISGTPTTIAAATNYIITATNLAGSGAANIYITVNPQLPAISYATPQTYTENVAITTLSPTSTGGPVASYSAASLPAGLSINASTGVITGTPTVGSAATNYTVTATNITGSATATISITVIVAAPTVPAVTQCGAGAVLTASDVSSTGGTYNWYSVATGGVAFQSSTSNTFSAICTATYYVSYTYGGIESARTSVTATVNPIVSLPYSGAYFSYPFNGNTNDVSSYQQCRFK